MVSDTNTSDTEAMEMCGVADAARPGGHQHVAPLFLNLATAFWMAQDDSISLFVADDHPDSRLKFPTVLGKDSGSAVFEVIEWPARHSLIPVDSQTIRVLPDFGARRSHGMWIEYQRRIEPRNGWPFP